MFSGIDHIGLFIAAGLLLNLTPGPDVLYIITSGVKAGWRAGAVAALGITAGCFVHIAAAALGVSALVAASATAFSVLKWLGAAYLVYVGWSMLGIRRKKSGPVESGDGSKIAINLIANDAISTRAEGQNNLRKVFMKGFWTNVLNPKVALFFLAFLPQFISPAAEHKTITFLVLGLLFNFNGLWINFGYAALGAFISQRLAVMQRGMQWLERVAGVLFIGFGLKLALSDNPAQ
ncbi:MAG: LysE family translocator [Rhodoferax sp.]|jgi:threonine/homoserine/homoserine lactone efflux protein|nr:LysE family translocator [Rhodoferax sp.]MBP7574676.1 LysE family translocator [Rhodoferax sp.]